MNTQHILQLARGVITNLSPIEENLYKGTLKIDDKIAGVYYFDLSNRIQDDFEAYQESLLADDFYSHPGSMQWNYYLFLLNDRILPEQKFKIEKNDKYARKFVLDEAEFADFFTIEKSSNSQKPNIVMEWKAALDAAGLQEIYTEEPYVDLFSRFDQDKAKKNPAANLKKQSIATTNINFINRLNLKPSYRPFPSKYRNFDFGKVNLFKGINGVGKTSLFEAVESIICGKCLRNEDQVMTNGCIEAEFNHSRKTTKYESNNTQLYQSRDFHWYSSNYSRGNYLFNSFNQFNFFNADAAHRFSNGKTEKEIRDALYNIVLGPEFTYISERCQKSLERIRPESKRMSLALKDAKIAVATAIKIIKGHKDTDGLIFIKNKIRDCIKVLRFKNHALDIERNNAEIEEINSQLKTIINNFKLSDYSYSSLNHFEIERLRFENKKQRFIALEKQIKDFNEQLVSNSAAQKEWSDQLNLISNCLSYLQDPMLMQLSGIEQKINENLFALSKIDYVKNLIADIDTSKLKSAVDIHSLISNNVQVVETTRQEISKSQLSINQYLEQFSKFEALIKEIKSLGKTYLQEVPIVKNCPMCETPFESSELERRINIISSTELSNENIDVDLHRQAILLGEENIRNLEQHNTELQAIGNAYFAYRAVRHNELSLSETIAYLDEVIRERTTLEKIANELKNINDYANSLNKSEKEFKELESSCFKKFGDELTFAFDHYSEFTDKLEALSSLISISKEDYEEKNKLRIALGVELKALLDITGDQVSLKDAKEVLNVEEIKFNAFKALFDRLGQLIELEPDDSLSELMGKVELLENNLDIFRTEIRAQFVLDEAIQSKEKNELYIEKNEAKTKRYEAALNTLQYLTGDDATKHVGAFFDDNFVEIVDIFKSIHVPREFTDIKFENDRLQLVTDTGGTRGVSQISTGQRSALALSIFLSLNRKLKNGPDIILFDDPVAFIDDLNALSFLDYLRLNVLSSGKQIFFATANMRLAGLFEKKFAFLDDGFKKWELSREFQENALIN